VSCFDGLSMTASQRREKKLSIIVDSPGTRW
jgi:hypothetical protein